MYLSQFSQGIALNPTDVSITIIPDLIVRAGETIDMSQFIVDPGNARTGTAVNGLSGFATYNSGTELLTGVAFGVETNVTLEVTF